MTTADLITELLSIEEGRTLGPDLTVVRTTEWGEVPTTSVTVRDGKVVLS